MPINIHVLFMEAMAMAWLMAVRTLSFLVTSYDLCVVRSNYIISLRIKEKQKKRVENYTDSRHNCSLVMIIKRYEFLRRSAKLGSRTCDFY